MYYPQSQIESNLYTNGDTFVRSDTKQQYVGYYYSVSNGKFFTGKTPSTPDSVELIKAPNLFEDEKNNIPNTTPIPIQRSILNGDNSGDLNFNSISIIRYSRLQTDTIFSDEKIQIPYYVPQLPTNEDYSIGEFRRYFCKKTNELIYIEINKTQYDKLVSEDPQILYQLYKPFFLTWQITGDKQTVAKTNKNIVELKSKRERLPKLGDYLKNDYIKYYKE